MQSLAKAIRELANGKNMESLTDEEKLELRKKEDALIKAFAQKRMEQFEAMRTALLNSNGPLSQPFRPLKELRKSIWSRFLDFFSIADTAH